MSALHPNLGYKRITGTGPVTDCLLVDCRSLNADDRLTTDLRTDQRRDWREFPPTKSVAMRPLIRLLFDKTAKLTSNLCGVGNSLNDPQFSCGSYHRLCIGDVFGSKRRPKGPDCLLRGPVNCLAFLCSRSASDHFGSIQPGASSGGGRDYHSYGAWASGVLLYPRADLFDADPHRRSRLVGSGWPCTRHRDKYALPAAQCG